MKNRSNIVLIGMPGAGKSTIGVILAKLASKDFLDTDLLIQAREQKQLQEIVNSAGYMELRRIEQEVLLDINVDNHVIATGGSAAYSETAMLHLKRSGIIVFLNVEIKVLESRIHNFATRGLAKNAEQSFEELFEERSHLYRKYADIELKCGTATQEDLCEEILRAAGKISTP